MNAWRVDVEPFLPLTVLALGACALLTLAALSAMRRPRGVGWRLSAGVLVLGIALNPVLRQETRTALPDIAVVVVDDSASQTLERRGDDTRTALARLQAQLKALPRVETRVVHSGEASSTNGTRLFADVQQALNTVPPEQLGAVFLITDGQVHDIPAGFSAPLTAVPVHALITGHDGEYDRRVVFHDTPPFAVVGQPLRFSFAVHDQPQRGATATVDILHNGRLVERREVRTGETVSFALPIERSGPNIIEVATPAQSGELTALNNRAVMTVKAVRENMRVLLVSGKPHAGERIWRNLLKSDAGIDLVHFTILRPPDKVDSTPVREMALIAFPTRELFLEKIDQFDLIIFDRYERRGILPMTYFENMARYVREGGALLVVSGPEDAGVDSVYQTALAGVLAAAPTGALIEKAFIPRLTPDGQRHPVTRDLPGAAQTPPRWSRWFRTVVARPTGGQALMQGADGAPLLVLNDAAAGRTATLLSDQVWLWARGFEGGGPHSALLRRIVHWLLKEPELDADALRASQQGMTLAVERQSLTPVTSPVDVTSPDGRTEQLVLKASAPGVWSARLTPSQTGLYRFTQDGKTALCVFGSPDPVEFAEVHSTVEKLSPLLRKNGGAIVRLNTPAFNLPRLRHLPAGQGMAGAGWLGLRANNASTLDGFEAYGEWTAALGLILALGLLCLAWWRESR